MEVRLATPEDVEATRAIYNREVTTSTAVFDMVPRSEEQQRAWLAAHAGVHPAIIGVEAGQVVGFASISPYRGRPAYATTVEDSVYVRHDRRGTGFGRALLVELLDAATARGFHSVMGRVVGHNQASIAVHRACGFELVGVEREVGRKFGRWMDVVVLQRLL